MSIEAILALLPIKLVINSHLPSLYSHTIFKLTQNIFQNAQDNQPKTKLVLSFSLVLR